MKSVTYVYEFWSHVRGRFECASVVALEECRPIVEDHIAAQRQGGSLEEVSYILLETVRGVGVTTSMKIIKNMEIEPVCCGARAFSIQTHKPVHIHSSMPKEPEYKSNKKLKRLVKCFRVVKGWIDACEAHGTRYEVGSSKRVEKDRVSDLHASMFRKSPGMS